jgi:hypothetical protein
MALRSGLSLLRVSPTSRMRSVSPMAQSFRLEATKTLTATGLLVWIEPWGYHVQRSALGDMVLLCAGSPQPFVGRTEQLQHFLLRTSWVHVSCAQGRREPGRR